MNTKKKVIANLKPSALLTLAINDLKEVRKDKRYKIEMGTWHSPYMGSIGRLKAKKCFVCLAGAAMARSLRVKPTEHIHHPDKLGRRVGNALAAINRFRTGAIFYGLQRLGIDGLAYGFSPDRYTVVTHYRKNPRRFFKDMNVVVKLLQSKGL